MFEAIITDLVGPQLKPPSFETILSETSESFGFAHHSYVGGYANLVTSGGHETWIKPPKIINNFPKNWLDYYHKNNLSHSDPVIQTALNTQRAVIWNSDSLNDLEPDQKQVMGHGRDFGIKRGVTIPIFGRAGEFSLITFISDQSTKLLEKDIKEIQANLLLASNAFHHSVLENLCQNYTDDHPFTPKESQVLYWLSLAKTNGEISDIMTISEKTVEAHIYRIFTKLDVFNRTQAVSKAMLLGLVDPVR